MIRLALTASALTIAALVYGIPALCHVIAWNTQQVCDAWQVAPENCATWTEAGRPVTAQIKN